MHCVQRSVGLAVHQAYSSVTCSNRRLRAEGRLTGLSSPRQQPRLGFVPVCRSCSCSRPGARRAAVSCQASAANPGRLAVFVSGGGSNLKAIHNSILQGQLRAVIQLVVSDKPGCGGWQYAEQHGIATLHYNPKDKNSPSAAQVVEHLQTAEIEYIALAGYLKLIPAPLVAAYHRRIVNIHPGLLPDFGGPNMYGTRVHAATLESGAKESGATVHFVDEVYDQGPILQKATVPVLPEDTPATLAARVLQQEHVLYSRALSHLLEGRVEWDEATELPFIVS